MIMPGVALRPRPVKINHRCWPMIDPYFDDHGGRASSTKTGEFLFLIYSLSADEVVNLKCYNGEDDGQSFLFEIQIEPLSVIEVIRRPL